MTWLEIKKEDPENTPVRNPKILQLDYELIGFSNKATEKLIDVIRRKMDRCIEIAKKVLTTYNKCQTSSTKRIDKLPEHEEILKKLQKDELVIDLIKSLSEKVINSVIAQAAVSNCLLED